MNSVFKKDYSYEVAENLYVTLSSRNNPRGVDNSEIVTHFSQPLKLSREQYEVGLVSVCFTPEEKTKRVRRSAEDNTKLPLKLFPNLIVPDVKDITIKKTNEELFRFMMEVNDQSEKKEKFYFTALNTKAPPMGKVFFTLKNKATNVQEYLLFPSSFASAMGFPQRRIFPPGEYFANEIATTENLQAIASDAEFTLKRVTMNDGQNLISVTEEEETLYYFIPDEIKDRRQFFNSLTSFLLEKGYRLGFDFDDDGYATLEVMSTSRRATDYIRMDDRLIKCLGFGSTKFHVGQHKSKAPFNEQEFQKLEPEEVFWFGMAVYTQSDIPMDEPQNLELDSVVKTLNNALASTRHDSSAISFGYDDGYLEVMTMPENATVTLPSLLSDYFGIDKTIKFTKGTRVPLVEELVEEEEQEEYELEHKEKTEEKEKFLEMEMDEVQVMTNVVSNQQIGHRQQPVIRSIVLDDNKETVKQVFPSVLYLPVTGEDVQTIRLRLTDPIGRQFTCKKGTVTSAQLHFKSKF